MKPSNLQRIITPDWQMPSHVKAFCTTRINGVSGGNYASNNLALHVDDDKESVITNRQQLVKHYNLPSEPVWLNQIHSTRVSTPTTKLVEADAAYSNQPDQICVVLTADCLPLLVCDNEGREIAAIHAGWRGLLNGIIEKTLQKFSVGRDSISVWLGPAIGPSVFEVGADVRDVFIEQDERAQSAFKKRETGKWLANIYALAKIRLDKEHITSVFGGKYCTFTDDELFYSYRRDKNCGRMASLIWLDK